MGFDSKLRNAMVAGVCFIATCIFILTIPSINKATQIFTVRFFALVIPLLLFTAMFVTHMHGYAHLGRKHDSTLLTRSSQLTAIMFAFFGLAVIASIFANIVFTELEVNIANTAVGLSITLLLIPAILFAVAIIKMYRRFGIATIAAACITPAAVLTIWRPWPVALLVAVSVYLLYRSPSEK